ncbi:MAG: terminase family protein, partial [Rhodospirillaceae bacterium]|nr:terminase family protein [Rhodospirillaceae bacterium]
MFGPWVRIRPFPKQAAFLMCLNFEVLYGGAAGGGKSDVLLADGAQYAHVPHYNGIIFRRTFPEHAEMIQRSKEWWAGEGPVYNESKSFWTFPGGARLHFGHMQRISDMYNYKSSEFDYVAYDESTGFAVEQLEYVPNSRMRRRAGSLIPLRARYGTNPGGDDSTENILSHDWHVQKFGILSGQRQLSSDGKPCAFIPATVYDNPHINVEEYVAKLNHLPPLERARLLEGDWTVRPSGGMFTLDMIPNPSDRWRIDEVDTAVRGWDTASTLDGDWTVGALVCKRDQEYQISHITRFRGLVPEVRRRICQTAEHDGPSVAIRVEEEGGGSGKWVTDDLAHDLAAYDFQGVR